MKAPWHGPERGSVALGSGATSARMSGGSTTPSSTPSAAPQDAGNSCITDAEKSALPSGARRKAQASRSAAVIGRAKK